MKIPPPYLINNTMTNYIAKIEANRQFFITLNPPPEVIEKIQRVSLLKSSVFSARIEGNPLTIEEYAKTSDQQKKQEIKNIMTATKFIGTKISHKTKITRKIILYLHELIMNKIGSGGNFRKEMGAIFNQAGVAIYVSPPPQKILVYISDLINYLNSNEENFSLIKAFLAHLIFEKIHPFIDGNGRVGRLLINIVLRANKNEFNIDIPFEEYFEKHREQYYYWVDEGLRQTEDYLIFMLKAFYEQTEKIKQDLKIEMNKKETLLLPPRQEELFNIIREHRNISFDSLKRRFLKVPERTLRYDLKKLVDAKLIFKIGRTRGSYYRS